MADDIAFKGPVMRATVEADSQLGRIIEKMQMRAEQAEQERDAARAALLLVSGALADVVKQRNKLREALKRIADNGCCQGGNHLDDCCASVARAAMEEP